MTNFTPRPYQQRMLNAMAMNLKGQLICPTGGGKTFTMTTDSRRFLRPTKVILQVAPRLMLSEQLFIEFDKHLSDCEFLHRQISSETNIFHRSHRSLRRVKPLSPTTSPSEIRKTFEIAQKINKPLMLFVTYD